MQSPAAIVTGVTCYASRRRVAVRLTPKATDFEE
jgi:hypothetical protein